MILIGYRDLNLREMIEFINEELTLVIEKNIEDCFLKLDPQTREHPIGDEDICKLCEVNTLPPFLKHKFERSFELAILVLVLQQKQAFSFSCFSNLVGLLNKKEISLTFSYLKSVFTTENELSFLSNEMETIKKNAYLIMTTYLAKLYQDLLKVETCLQMERSKISINFLAEIEKGNLEDRRLIKLLNLYRNYFKNFLSDKHEPWANIYNELHIVSQMEFELMNLEKILLSKLSFEKKAQLQNKSVQENEYLKAFVGGYYEIICSVTTKVAQIRKIKSSRRNSKENNILEIEMKSEARDLQCLLIFVSSILEDLTQIHANLSTQEELDTQALIGNKKYKRRVSESWQIIETLAFKKSMDESKTSKLMGIDQFISTLQMKELHEALTKILATPVEVGKKPKIPKGTRDTTPLQMIIKFKAIEKIRAIYYKHGAVEIDTPIFELKETLLGKYGEEGGKLIYDLEDQGGELLSLRYDLTVPFARYMGLNNYSKMKRFHIGKVYRRDQPNMNRGRFREFYQCDFDIAGKTDPMLAEAEILKIAIEILSGFDLKFKIKISHRLLLEAIIECANCEQNKFKTICSSIDKLDKEPWEAVEKELQSEKGLAQNQTDILKKIVLNKGTISDVLNLAETSKLFGDNQKAKQSLNELWILDKYVKIFKLSDFIELDFSLARGLDYYTGVIYEGVLTEGEHGLGSICGGGRYDELIGMFSKDKIPAIGISIGIERLFTMLEEKYKKENRASESEFLIATIGKKGVLEKKLELAEKLWNANVKAEILYENHPKPDKQLKHALEKQIPFIIWIGEDEICTKKYKIKIMYKKEEILIDEDQLITQAHLLSMMFIKDLQNGVVLYPE